MHTELATVPDFTLQRLSRQPGDCERSSSLNMNTPAIALPEQYAAWHAALPLVHIVAFKKNQWQFYTLAELQAPTRVDKFKATNATQLRAFVEMYRTHGATDAEGPKKTKFSLERLAACIAIAVENADILFTDPCDGFSMWKLRPDECAVRPLNCTILEFIAAATVEDLQVD